MVPEFLQYFVPGFVRESKDCRFEVLAQQRRFREAEKLSLFDGVRRDRQDVATPDEDGTCHFSFYGFGERDRAPVERDRKHIAVDGDITNAVDLVFVETNL